MIFSRQSTSIFPVLWNVDVNALFTAVRNRLECDFTRDLLQLTAGRDIAYVLPPVPKTDTENIQSFDHETSERTVRELSNRWREINYNTSDKLSIQC